MILIIFQSNGSEFHKSEQTREEGRSESCNKRQIGAEARAIETQVARARCNQRGDWAVIEARDKAVEQSEKRPAGRPQSSRAEHSQ